MKYLKKLGYRIDNKYRAARQPLIEEMPYSDWAKNNNELNKVSFTLAGKQNWYKL